MDRSAAYAARWVAKSLVKAGLCRRVLVQVGAGLGRSWSRWVLGPPSPASQGPASPPPPPAPCRSRTPSGSRTPCPSPSSTMAPPRRASGSCWRSSRRTLTCGLGSSSGNGRGGLCRGVGWAGVPPGAAWGPPGALDPARSRSAERRRRARGADGVSIRRSRALGASPEPGASRVLWGAAGEAPTAPRGGEEAEAPLRNPRPGREGAKAGPRGRLTESGIVYSRDLDLKKPLYQRTAAYGHFGRDSFPWEVPKKLKY